MTIFASKRSAREAIWDALAASGDARYPFPTRGRIPNFKGADLAAARLAELSLFEHARHIKVNPDAPQRHVREAALRRGIVVYMPSPRLKEGFWRLDPATIPQDKLGEAACLTHAASWSEPVVIADMPPMDLIVCGAVAVTRDGRRLGNGAGFADLEYAILRSLGHPPVPVVTTVHPLQVVDAFPADPHDMPLSCIVTPDEVIAVAAPPPTPAGIDWDLLSGRDLKRMPVLAEVRELLAARRGAT